MNKNFLFLGGGIAIVAVILIGGVFFLSKTGSSPAVSQNSGVNGETTQIDQASLSPEAKERYIVYTDANLASTLDKGQKPVVFFHANWCVYCKAAEADILGNFDQVPKDITILKADYDTSTALKSKYKVFTQDTFVYLDENGKVVTKWISGGRGLDGILANVN